MAELLLLLLLWLPLVLRRRLLLGLALPRLWILRLLRVRLLLLKLLLLGLLMLRLLLLRLRKLLARLPGGALLLLLLALHVVDHLGNLLKTSAQGVELRLQVRLQRAGFDCVVTFGRSLNGQPA